MHIYLYMHMYMYIYRTYMKRNIEIHISTSSLICVRLPSYMCITYQCTYVYISFRMCAIHMHVPKKFTSEFLFSYVHVSFHICTILTSVHTSTSLCIHVRLFAYTYDSYNVSLFIQV